MEKFSVSIAEAIQQLKTETDKKFTVLLQHGSMQLEYFAPDKIDTQTPHLQDEIYVIASGQSDFFKDGITVACKTGDVLWVPAGMEHRFINFSNDFATWVIFYGPPGGAQSSQ
jgi:mannose-6-phosphate isomerase-like protein (cupin superfamily)